MKKRTVTFGGRETAIVAKGSQTKREREGLWCDGERASERDSAGMTGENVIKKERETDRQRDRQTDRHSEREVATERQRDSGSMSREKQTARESDISGNDETEGQTREGDKHSERDRKRERAREREREG